MIKGVFVLILAILCVYVVYVIYGHGGSVVPDQAGTPRLIISYPTPGSAFSPGQSVIVVLEVSPDTAVAKATAFVLPLLEKPVTVYGGNPINITVTIPATAGETTLKAIVIDMMGNRIEGSIPIVVAPPPQAPTGH